MCDNSRTDRDPETPEDIESFSLSPGQYFLTEPHLVLTAAYDRNRGRCCATGCHHCPFRNLPAESDAPNPQVEQ